MKIYAELIRKYKKQEIKSFCDNKTDVNNGTTKQRERKFIQTGTYRAVPRIKQVVEVILKQ